MPRQPSPAVDRQLARAIEHGLTETLPKGLGEQPILDDDICFPGQQQAERIDVRRTDGRPDAVDHCHLGMQEAAPVLEDADAGAEQSAVERLRGVVHQAVFDTSLQQDDHPHAT